MEELGSLMIEASKVSEVKGGDSLNVDREVFSTYITKKIKENKNILAVSNHLKKRERNRDFDEIACKLIGIPYKYNSSSLLKRIINK